MPNRGSTRLERWMDEEVDLIRKYYPELTGVKEDEYRTSLAETLRGAQLKLADDFDALARATGVEEKGDLVLAHLTAISDRARDYGLREFFRRFW